MKPRARRFPLLAAAGAAATLHGASAAESDTGKARARLPLRYASACPPPGDPNGITVRDGPKGPVVTFERPDLGALDTRDDNLAFVSRRFFFKLRTETELIEFQGRAEDGELTGLLSDARGARRIALPAVPVGATPRCGTKP